MGPFLACRRVWREGESRSRRTAVVGCMPDREEPTRAEIRQTNSLETKPSHAALQRLEQSTATVPTFPRAKGAPSSLDLEGPPRPVAVHGERANHFLDELLGVRGSWMHAGHGGGADKGRNPTNSLETKPSHAPSTLGHAPHTSEHAKNAPSHKGRQAAPGQAKRWVKSSPRRSTTQPKPGLTLAIISVFSKSAPRLHPSVMKASPPSSPGTHILASLLRDAPPGRGLSEQPRTFGVLERDPGQAVRLSTSSRGCGVWETVGPPMTEGRSPGTRSEKTERLAKVNPETELGMAETRRAYRRRDDCYLGTQNRA